MQDNRFIEHALDCRDTHLPAAGGDYRVHFRRKHNHLDAGFLQCLYADRVAAVCHHHFFAFVVHIHMVIGHNSVKIEHQQPDIIRQRAAAIARGYHVQVGGIHHALIASPIAQVVNIHCVPAVNNERQDHITGQAVLFKDSTGADRIDMPGLPVGRGQRLARGIIRLCNPLHFQQR